MVIILILFSKCCRNGKMDMNVNCNCFYCYLLMGYFIVDVSNIFFLRIVRYFLRCIEKFCYYMIVVVETVKDVVGKYR